MTALQIDERYKIKGTIVRNFREYVRRRKGDDFFDRIFHESGFGASGIILPSSWYSAEKYLRLQALMAEAVSQSPLGLNKEFAREWLEHDMNGIYRFFMRVGKPQRVLSKMSQIDKGYVNYSEIIVTKNEPGLWLGEVLSPLSLVDWHLSCIQGGMEGVFNVCKVPLERINEQNSNSSESESPKYSEGNAKNDSLFCLCE